MVKLTCSKCGKIHTLNSIHDFSACSCGSTLTHSIKDLIHNVENSILEINYEINKCSSEKLCGKFSVNFD